MQPVSARDGLILSFSNYFQTLWTTAETYLSLKYSVIPLRGDLDTAQPKAAAVPWKVYQSRRATLSDLHNWFIEQQFPALGIVTGRISRLMVLDFDTPELFQYFKVRYPHLTQTRTIQTHRGWHLYFCPPDVPLSSRKGSGVDLLSEGCYVVAPPSTIGETAYRITRGGQPRSLTSSDLHAIHLFLDSLSPQPESSPQLPPHQATNREVPSLPPQPEISASTLIATYLKESIRGRNQALFRAALIARDNGWTNQAVLNCLAARHAHHPGGAGHIEETVSQRLREAQATIDSIFSHPPRHKSPQNRERALQLPNTVREKLLQLNQTATLRTIEALFHLGITPGTNLTRTQIVEYLAGTVGDWSIRIALASLSPDGSPIFPRINPSPEPPTQAKAASHSETDTTKKCFFGGAEKPTGSLTHRPATHFLMPSIPELCQMLDVKPAGSDPISLDDLSSARKTRQAIHRELIKRRPGIYPRRWLAARLGVCKETLDAYNRDIPIHFKHLFHETPINWSNLNRVPSGVVISGAFLEDNEGKRYPARRQIAAHLLRQGRAVRYKQQDANYYWFGDSAPIISLNLGLHPNLHELAERQQEVRHYIDRWNQLHPSASDQTSSPPRPATRPPANLDRQASPPEILTAATTAGQLPSCTPRSQSGSLRSPLVRSGAYHQHRPGAWPQFGHSPPLGRHEQSLIHRDSPENHIDAPERLKPRRLTNYHSPFQPPE